METQRDGDLSVTGALAALLVFVLGVYCMRGDLRVAAGAGVTLVALMAFKQFLHDWLEKLTWPELRSGLLILGATAVALPLLPDTPVGPFSVIVPRELWFLTILVACASFAGYVAVRIFGDQRGILVGAAAGALVSSTVVTADLGRRVRAGETDAAVAAAGAATAATISISKAAAFMSVIAPVAFVRIGPALACGALAFAAAAWLLTQRGGQNRSSPAGGLHNPLDVISVTRFGILLGAFTIATRLISNAFGEAGLLPFAAAAGLADVDLVTLAVASLSRHGLDPAAAGHAILLAVLVNTFSKGMIAALSGGPQYAGRYLAAAVAAAIAGWLSWSLATPWLMSWFS